MAASPEPRLDPPGRWIALALIALAQAGANSTWFSTAAIVPSLEEAWGIGRSDAGLLSVAVQVGFMVGTLASAVVGVADLVPARRLFAIGALLAAAANAALVLPAVGLSAAVLLRFMLGLSMAWVYPVALKLAAEWFRFGRGLAIGVLVGALTLGSALPHLVAGLGVASSLPWQAVILGTSVLAVASAILVTLWVREGPFRVPASRLDLRWAFRAFRDPANRLAHLGYFGHVWELYGMWTWLPVFMAASFAVSSGGGASSTSVTLAALATFAVIAAGGAGSVVGGLLADRFGRTATAATAMVVSALAAVLTGLLFGSHPVVVVIVALVWGATVVADSSQFSAGISELSASDRVGSALTLQHALGYLLSAVSIQLVPVLESRTGWAAAFALLALGPLLGAVAMLRLRRRPEAIRMANGRR